MFINFGVGRSYEFGVLSHNCSLGDMLVSYPDLPWSSGCSHTVGFGYEMSYTCLNEGSLFITEGGRGGGAEDSGSVTVN